MMPREGRFRELLGVQISMEGVVKSRAKRWANCLDEFTWPEILRRYLLASRVGMTLQEHLHTADETVDTSTLDDDSACMLGARLLARLPAHRWVFVMIARMLFPPPDLSSSTCHPIRRRIHGLQTV